MVLRCDRWLPIPEQFLNPSYELKSCLIGVKLLMVKKTLTVPFHPSYRD